MLGQYLAIRVDLSPIDTRRELENLFDNVEGMHFAIVEEVLGPRSDSAVLLPSPAEPSRRGPSVALGRSRAPGRNRTGKRRSFA
jgi:hypothetical protein